MDVKGTYKYFRTRLRKGQVRLEFDSLKDFCRFAENQHVKNMLVLEDAGVTYFAFALQGGLVAQPATGFQTLEDYQLSGQNGFPDAATFYDSRERGYNNYADYVLTQLEAKIDKEVFEKMEKAGFITGFKDWEHARETDTMLAIDAPIGNAYDLFKWADEREFQSYEIFKKAMQRGFREEKYYHMACERGYESFAEYEAGNKGDFANAAEYRLGMSLKARSRKELSRLASLERATPDKAQPLDQKLLLVFLSKLPPAKKIALDKLEALFKKELESHRREETGELPEWLTISLTDREAFIQFLTGKEISAFGHYHASDKYFETVRINERAMLIDGNNVAYGNNEPDKLPRLVHILKLLQELKGRKVSNIVVIAGVAVSRLAPDKNLLEEIKNLATYVEAPTDYPIEQYLVNHIKAYQALIITNNDFKKYRHYDPWIGENLDFYRLSLEIKGDQVTVSDLD